MSYKKLILYVFNLITSQNKSKKIVKQKIMNTETQQDINLIFIYIIPFSLFFQNFYQFYFYFPFLTVMYKSMSR